MHIVCKWWEDTELESMSAACDEAYYKKDIDLMRKLANECDQRANDKSKSNMVRAKYFYNGYTILHDFIEQQIKQNPNDSNTLSGIKQYEKEYEKCFYLARSAFELIYLELEKGEDVQKIDIAHFKSFYFQMIVNFSNLLCNNGRIIKAIEYLSIFFSNQFPMGNGNLGMKIFEYARLYYDPGHQAILLCKSYKSIQDAIKNPSEYPEKEYFEKALNEYSKKITDILTSKYLNKNRVTDLVDPYDDSCDEEAEYRHWIASNKLALNVLNDVSVSNLVGYDPIHLPTIIGGKKARELHGLFNQIKQEYVSARFLAYEGLTKREPHFSDRDVLLINTLDYPVYGLGIEKIKAAYRAIYALFDRIAYFLNEYFQLGIGRKKVNYYRIWHPKKTEEDERKLTDYAESNYPLLGLWWLFKDIRCIDVDGSNIDKRMDNISSIRNAMEHRYFKVIDDINPVETNDGLTYKINFLKFEAATIDLLKYAREAIILTVLSVDCEEQKKEVQLENQQKIALPMHMSKYEDDWKQIF